jgi:hypothetical protein
LEDYSMLRIICAALLIFSLLDGLIVAAEKDWTAVQRLAAGDQVQADLPTGKTLKGRVDHSASESLFILTKGKVTEIPRKEINRLYLKTRGSWKTSTLLGLGLGAAAGGGIGAGLMERETGFGGAVAGTIVLFAAIGAGVGYALRPSQWVLIYEAPPISR